MARRKRKKGVCHICGNFDWLSFEHVPPQKAFNDKRVITIPFKEAVKLGPDVPINGAEKQGGVGEYTLCDRCNNNTGSWYGNKFIDWCYQGMEILIRSRGKPSLIYMQYLFPLAILKQIVSMFCSVNSDKFAEVNSVFRKFLLNRDAKYLPPKYRFYCYYNIEGALRYIGLAVSADFYTGKKITLSEISYPPFGYVMTIDSIPPDKRLFEITHFANYDYNEFVVMNLKLPVLPTHTLLPGDYRTMDEIYPKDK